MKDNQNTYLDKVVEFLVRNTKMDYDKGEIQYPFIRVHFNARIDFIYPPFKKYCKNVYGLTDQEIKYVWKEYKEKIENGK